MKNTDNTVLIDKSIAILNKEARTEGMIHVLFSTRERELVALGAALGSNCVPCIEYHIPHARKAGLTDLQISEAIWLADRIKQVPASKVLEGALKLLPANSTDSRGGIHLRQHPQ